VVVLGRNALIRGLTYDPYTAFTGQTHGMNNLIRDFRDHPESVGETYGQHWRSAMSFAFALMGAALVCAIHAFVPGLFKQTASRTITRLYRRMVTHRHRGAADDAPEVGRRSRNRHLPAAS
jgi:hypothetical protein